ncbi:Phospholipase D p2 [Platanthera zijinensis]|uniref:Phospholipase D p2 n=1 Tax=Platanthera zijinensis TaxID=2320716 RepID=A0AAP0BRY5_9ASPA
MEGGTIANSEKCDIDIEIEGIIRRCLKLGLHLIMSYKVPPDPAWIFDELPKASIVSVSRPDASDITPMLLSYTIEFKYKKLI